MYRTLCLATDLQPSSATPWIVAWRLASSSRADLVVLHVQRGAGRPAWGDMPAPETLMDAWGVAGEPVDGGFRGEGWRGVCRTEESLDSPKSVAGWLQFAAPDLVVVGTHRRSAPSRLLYPSMGELLSRSAPHAALVIPDDVESFVCPSSGAVRLRRVLVPVASDLSPELAVSRAVELVESAGVTQPVAFVVLHVGERTPDVPIPAPHRLSVTLGLAAPSSVVRRIAETARDLDVDLIAMVTRGHDSLLDALWGSHTDRVIRSTPCPVLVVPTPGEADGDGHVRGTTPFGPE